MSNQFKYVAVSAEGQKQSGTVTAASENEALRFLSDNQFTPLSIKEVAAKHAFNFWGFVKRTDYENLINFTNSLSTLYRAGVPILRALSLIRVGKPNGRLNKAITQVKYDMQTGQSLSAALAKHSNIFSKVYVSSIAAGEESGKLDVILDEMSDMLEAELELTREIKSGVRYPLMVISAVALAFTVLMVFVIPRFVAFFGAFNAELPLPTRIIIAISDFFQTYWPLLLVGGVSLGFGFVKLVSTEKGKLWVDQRILGLPILGEVVIKGNVARFAMMFSILFKAGIPLIKSLELVRESVKNLAISREINRMELFFREGQEGKLLMKELVYFPQMALQMLHIGLESGALDRILGEIGHHYSKQVRYTTKNLTSILEPILTLVLGVFILILALAIFLPMWNLIQVFKQ